MSVINLRLPDSLHETAREVARRENISVNQLVTLAVAEKLSALLTEDYLRERAQRGSRAAFEAAMRKVPDLEPESYDVLQEAEVALRGEGLGSYGSDRPPFADVWQRIIAHKGETFRQLQGGEFTYEVRGNYIVVNRAGRDKTYNIARAALEKAYEVVPLANTLPVQGLRGPSYLYAILMDSRIRQGDW